MSNGDNDGTPRVRRADLLVQSWDGFIQVLQQMYNQDSLVLGAKRRVAVEAVSNVDNVEAELRQKSLPYELPLIGVSLGAVEPNLNSYNPSVLRKYGVPSRISDDRSTWSVLSLEPVLLTLQLVIVTDDQLTMLRIIDRWMSQQLWSFRLEDPRGEWGLGVRAEPDKNFSMMPPAPTQGGSLQFRQTCSVRLAAYSGYVFYVPSIYTIDVQTKVTAARDLRALEQQDLVDDFDLTAVITAPDHEPEA